MIIISIYLQNIQTTLMYDNDYTMTSLKQLKE